MKLVTDKPSRLVKGSARNDERFVLGIVLEPGGRRAGRIYSAEEDPRRRPLPLHGGLPAGSNNHRLRVNGQVKCWRLPRAHRLHYRRELAVPQGTWLLAVRDPQR